MFLKPGREINDLNDISLVNPDEERKTILNLIGKIILDSFSNVFIAIIIIVLDFICLKYLSYSNSMELFIDYFLCICIIHTILLCLIIGVNFILNSRGKQRKLYYEALAITHVYIILIFIPIIGISYFFTPYQAWKNYLLWSPIYAYFKLIFINNLNLIYIRNYRFVGILLVLKFMGIQLSSNYYFTIILNKGLFGVVLSFICGYAYCCILSYITLYFIVPKIFSLDQSTIISMKEDFGTIDSNDNSARLDIDYEAERRKYNKFVSYFLNLKNALISLFYFNPLDRNSSNIKKEKLNYFTFFDKKNFKNNNALASSRESLKSKEDYDEPFNDYYEIENEINTPLIENIKSFNKSISFSLVCKIIGFLMNISLLSILNYLGYAIIIVFGYHSMTHAEQVANIVIINIVILIFLVGLGLSTTLTDYISLESFSHSHSNKYRFTKICFILMMCICAIFSLILQFYTKDISLFLFDNEQVRSHVNHIISWYVYFIFPHNISIMLDSFVVAASENNIISYILGGAFSLVVIPITLILYHIGYSYLVIWYGFFLYNIIHLCCMIIYLLHSKVFF